MAIFNYYLCTRNLPLPMQIVEIFLRAASPPNGLKYVGSYIISLKDRRFKETITWSFIFLRLYPQIKSKKVQIIHLKDTLFNQKRNN